ncbi:hypothetical protein D3C72_2159610 [compost metagenome]
MAKCIHASAADTTTNSSMKQLLQIPSASFNAPNTIGRMKPPKPPIMPTTPPTAPTCLG